MQLDGSAVDRLLEPGGARLGVARTTGAVTGRTSGDEVAWIVVESGTGTLRAAGAEADVSGRRDVFTEPGWSAFVGPDDSFALAGADVRATVVWRSAPGRPATSRIIAPTTVPEEERGSGATSRRVRTYVGEGPIIAGETLNPPGGWSSYPPHRHEHEEVYVYRFDPAHGFGVAVEYEDDRREARIVRDGDVQRIASGYHPVVAAPGYAMYYLWALAGSSDVLTPEFDPVHATAG